MTALFWKELADHFGRRRFALLLGLVALGLVWGAFVDLGQLARSGRQFFFLDVFTTTAGVPISLLSFLSFFGPVIGIALGFDAINGERTQGTLARLLAQPLHRDSVYNAKFLAALLTLALVVASMMIVVIGLTMFRMGIAPHRRGGHTPYRSRPRHDRLPRLLARPRHHYLRPLPQYRYLRARLHRHVVRARLPHHPPRRRSRWTVSSPRSRRRTTPCDTSTSSRG